MSAVVEVVEDVVETVVDVADFVVDDVINPVVDTATDIVDAVLDDPIKAAAQIAAIATGNAWALPLIEGADVAIDGGDIGDVLESTAKAYVAQQVGGYVGGKAGAAASGAGAGEVASTVIGAGSGRAASAVVLGRDPVQAFVTGGISAGVPAALGQVDGFTDLPVSAQKVIEASVTAELTGGEVDATVIGNAIIRANITSDAVQEYAKANGGNIPDSEAALVADVIANTATTAFAGGNVSQAVQNSVMRYGARELNKVIDKNVRNTIDGVSGTYDKVEAQARELERLKDANMTAIDNYNAVVDRMKPRFDRRDALFAEYEKVNETFQNNPSQANADAVNKAVKAYNDYAAKLDKDITNTFQPQLDKYEKQINDTTKAFETGTETYNNLRDDLVSKSDQLGSELEPMYEATNRAFVQAMDPNFNEAEYRRLNGLGNDVNAYEHYLEEGQFEGLPTNMSNAEGTILSEKMRLLDDALESKGLNLSNLNKSQVNNLYDQIDKKYGDNVKALQNAQINDLNVNKAFRGASATSVGDTTSGADLYKATGKMPDGSRIATDAEVANGTAQLITTEEGGRWVTYTVPKGYWDPNSGEFIATNNIPQGVESTPGYTFSRLKDVDPNAYLETVANGGDAIQSQVGSYVYDFAVNAMNLARDSGNSTIQNGAANALKAGGGILEAFNGLVVLAGENPNNTELGKFANSLVNLGAAGNTQEYQTAIADINKQIGDAEGFLGTAEAIFGAFQDHPTEFLAEYVGVEGMQELVPLLIGGGAATFAKGSAKLLGATDDFARIFGSRSGLGAAAVTDVAESFGGAAQAAYNDAYNTARAQGLSEAEATQTALEIANRTGTVSAMATAVSFGMGGDALERVLLGDKAKGAASSALNSFADRVARGGTVTIAEGVTEGIEEGVSQLYLEGQLYQLDPNRDIQSNIASATIFGAIAGSGVSGGAYAGTQIGDVTSNILSTANTQVKELINTAPKNAAGAQQVQNKLNDFGITSELTQTNILNEVYNPAYTSTGEALQSFGEFEYYDANNDEIYSFVGNVPDSQRESRIEDYIDPRYTDEAEVRAAAEAEGITLTDEEVQSYVQQRNEQELISEARQEFDPRATTYEEAEAFFRDTFGYTPTQSEVNQFVASIAESEQRGAVGEYVDPRQVDREEAEQFFADFNYNPSEQEIQDFMQQGGANFEATAPDRFDTYVDPRQVTEEEARQFFADFGYTPTDEQVQQFVAQVRETEQSENISKYVDPRQITMDEVQVIADEEGLTLTEALAQTYIGQGEAETFQAEQLAEARKEYDPLATTLEEATQFLADTGYEATAEEIAQFVASKAEDVQQSEIGAYVDPRQVTATEAEEFLSAIGYQPTQEEIDNFTGQLNDETYQSSQQSAVDAYVDPRYVDPGEVRAEYERLGLVDVLQDDVDKFVGQYMETELKGRVGEYTPIATYNIIKSLLGSGSVEDDPSTPDVDESKDATGIYGQLEGLEQLGIDRDEAIAQLAEDLGVTSQTLSDAISDVEQGVVGVQEDLTAVADLVGKPVQDVTDVDVDFVADLIAQQEALSDPSMFDFTEQQLSYDVTGDGIVNQADLDIMQQAQQGQQVEFAPESKFAQPTGLYGTVQDTKTELEQAIDLSQQTLSQEIKDVEERQFKMGNVRQLQNMLMQAGDIGGQQVTVKSPDPAQIRYMYDFSSIFATPQQQALFPSPYAEGGHVEDPNDALLRLLEGK